MPVTSAVGLRHAAEEAAGGLPPLLVEAERVAATIVQGVHGRRRVGQGDAFWQFRPYAEDDPASLIDWRQSARGDGHYVRENEWEAAESVWLWRDGSRSMDWASSRELPSKRRRAEVLALALAILLVRAGERVALLDAPAPPATGRAVLNRLERALATEVAADAPSLPAPRRLPRFARVVLVGDLLDPPAAIDAAVAGFAGAGVRGCLVQVLDPAEHAFPWSGRVRFAGLEAEGELLVRRAESLAADYRAKLAAQRAALRTIAQTRGWYFIEHATDGPASRALLALFAALGRE